jgi:hypothetical protein
MVSSKNRNYHRNHGCNLVEIAFASMAIAAMAIIANFKARAM